MHWIKRILAAHFVLAILAGSVALWTAGSIIQHQIDGSKPRPGLTWFREEVDFKVYFSGQGWIIPGRLLYDHGYAEYPPLGVIYGWWPRLVTDNFEFYHWLLWLSNSLLYVLAGYLTWRLARLWQLPESAWWLWLMPSAIYYSLNRFDILPVTLVLLSLYWLKTGRIRSAGLSYGAAVAAKFYPLLLLPLLGQLFKKQPTAAITFVVYGLAPILSLSVAVAVAGGPAALWFPYFLQLSRGFEAGSVGAWLVVVWPEVGEFMRRLFSLCQIVVPLGWVVWSFLNKLAWRFLVNLRLAALAVAVFIFFNHFYSNQWWLWLMPFLALVWPPRLVYWLGAYDLVNYLEFPLLAEIFGKNSHWFNWVVGLRSGLLLFIIFMLVRQLVDSRRNFYENVASGANL